MISEMKAIKDVELSNLKDTMTMIAPVRVIWVEAESCGLERSVEHFRFRKNGERLCKFLLCKSSKCANERFIFLRYFGAAKEKKICLLSETKRKFRATKKKIELCHTE